MLIISVFFFFKGACCGFSLGRGRDGFGAALAGIAFLGNFAFCGDVDVGAAYEDEDDAGSAGALFGGGGFGFMALGSWPCPEAAARDASAARRAPSVPPSCLKTSSFTLGSRFGAIFSCQANLPR